MISTTATEIKSHEESIACVIVPTVEELTSSILDPGTRRNAINSMGQYPCLDLLATREAVRQDANRQNPLLYQEDIYLLSDLLVYHIHKVHRYEPPMRNALVELGRMALRELNVWRLRHEEELGESAALCEDIKWTVQKAEEALAC